MAGERPGAPPAEGEEERRGGHEEGSGRAAEASRAGLEGLVLRLSRHSGEAADDGVRERRVREVVRELPEAAGVVEEPHLLVARDEAALGPLVRHEGDVGRLVRRHAG